MRHDLSQGPFGGHEAPRPIDGAGIAFLWAELDMGATFATLAHTSPDPTIRDRERTRALEAYETVRSFLPRLRLSAEEVRQVCAALVVLRQDIDAIRPGR